MDAVYTHAIETQKPFLKDPGSAITHFIGAVASVFGAVPSLVKAHRTGDPACIVSMTVFISKHDPALYSQYRLSFFCISLSVSTGFYRSWITS